MAEKQELDLDEVLKGKGGELNRDGTITLPNSNRTKRSSQSSRSKSSRVERLIDMLTDSEEEQQGQEGERSPNDSREDGSTLIED